MRTQAKATIWFDQPPAGGGAPSRRAGRVRPAGWATAAALLLLGLSPAAEAFVVTVVGGDGGAPDGFYWVVEEDRTNAVIPGEAGTDWVAKFHASAMPVMRSGRVDAGNVVDIDGLPVGRRYFVSVLPTADYSNGGAAVPLEQPDVQVLVQKLPLPTAQITVEVFQDNQPVNGAWDQPEEPPLAGWNIVVYEAGGRYGMSGGQVSQDAFGNPLGTTYAYDGDGNPVLDANGEPQVEMLGDTIIKSDENGQATIKFLAPAKYTIQAIPPAGQGWIQTSTIEGTKGIDAWVKAGEPPYFAEFGPPGPHVFVGYVQPTLITQPPGTPAGSTVLMGQIVNNHLSHPATITTAPAFNAGVPFEHTTAWVGLNDLGAGNGSMIYAQPADADGNFAIAGVRPGAYELVVWDSHLDLIIAFQGVVIGPEPVHDLGPVPVFNWFAGAQHEVFLDRNANGFREPSEPGIPGQVVNLRFRDGSMYQTATTNENGTASFDEIFPFFNWLIAEVDFGRYKATGATLTIDAGGEIDPTDPWSWGGRLSPQLQPDGLPYRTDLEPVPVLLQGFQAFLGQNNGFQWGKQAYAPGENGGITGVVYYASTRGENDPRYGAADPWEPGVANVPLYLYLDLDRDGQADDLDGNGASEQADFDFEPVGNFPGPEDRDLNDNGEFDYGDAVQEAVTDSFDANRPTGCVNVPGDVFYDVNNPRHKADSADACHDGMRNWNQVRPAVFDGGYGFFDYYANGLYTTLGNVVGAPLPDYREQLGPGTYIVEAVVPPGYKIVAEEDKNVDFGDSYVPAPQLLAPPCVGDLHEVPAELALFPGVESSFPSVNGARPQRPYCDRRQVRVQDRRNTAADFFVFTEAPIAGHIVGMILDDIANEFDPNSPQFGEKYAPPWIPVSLRDWSGAEIGRTYSDQFGQYEMLVPSTYNANIPMPSGYAPNMLTVCLNTPVKPAGPDQPGGFVTEPFFNPQYSQFCYTFQYMPGTTTYLDTPVVHVAAFAGPDQAPLDCELPNNTPRLRTVVNSNPAYPGPFGVVGDQLVLTSLGTASEVLNPAYDRDVPGSPRLITRDYGFGARRTRSAVTIDGRAQTIVSWTPESIVVRIAASTTTGQLVVVRDDGGATTATTQTGITATIARRLSDGRLDITPRVVRPGNRAIQRAIDTANASDLILVAPGVYTENVILWKPVRLQGAGSGSTVINAVRANSNSLDQWRRDVQRWIEGGRVDLLPNQPIGFGGIEPTTLFNEESPGVIVLAARNGGNRFRLIGGQPNGRVDGFTITSADHGGGVMVNGYAHYLQLTNLRVSNNTGFYGGGIRVGHPLLLNANEDGYQSAFNDHVLIASNEIIANGGLDGVGGGVTLHTGSDQYTVRDNWICGNFTGGEGAGIGHQGFSDAGRIQANRILFNQSFKQGLTVSGGGILVAGAPSVAVGLCNPDGASVPPVACFSEGSGNVTINDNLILGNQAGAGDGGGIALERVNGADVRQARRFPILWNWVNILDNLIVNNQAALAGGGISLQDSANVSILHNTLAHNESLATAAEAFPPGSTNQSLPQIAGIASRRHSPELWAALLGGNANPPGGRLFSRFSNPLLVNTIVWENRALFVQPSTTQVTGFELVRATPLFRDLGVVDAVGAERLSPSYCLLTSPLGVYAGSNNQTVAHPDPETTPDPLFRSAYFNGYRGFLTWPEATTGLPQIGVATDEGGNAIDVHFGPLTLSRPDGTPWGDYHLRATRRPAALGYSLLFPELSTDIDGDPRPLFGPLDRGADQYR